MKDSHEESEITDYKEPEDFPALPLLDFQSQIEEIDIAKGLENFSGDEKTYLRVLRKFACNIRFLLSSLKEVNEENLGAYEITIHGIKGSSFIIYAAQISEMTKTLEDAAKDKDLDYIKMHNPAFLEAAEALSEKIDVMLREINAVNPKPKKARPDPEVLKKLAEACEFFSMNKADAAMNEIDAFQYEDDGGLADWLREKVDLMQFADIINKLSDI